MDEVERSLGRLLNRDHSSIWGGNAIRFPATVNFAPARTLLPSVSGFPPVTAEPGAVGQPG